MITAWVRLGRGCDSMQPKTVSFFFSSRRRHTILQADWSSDVCASDLSQCYRAEDALKAFPLGGGKARARSQVVIDDLDLLPAQRTHPFGHRILEALTFLILSYLLFAGLPKVDDRLASQMLRFDFGIVQELCHFLFSTPREPPLL